MAGERLLQQGAKRRTAILKFIGDFRREHHYRVGPTIQEIAEGVGLGSANATRHHLMRLKEEGAIEMDTDMGRSIALKHEMLTLEEVSDRKWPKNTRFLVVTAPASARRRRKAEEGLALVS